MRPRLYLPAASVLIALIFIAGNLVARHLLAPVRLDFTEHQLFTLSKGTKSTLKGVTEPVEITLVYSRRTGQDYPAVSAYAARVRELLGAYEDISGGRVRVREIDPAPFSPAEDEALAAGISPIETEGPDPLYFGLVGRNTIDDERVVPFLAPELETTLEYDLTRMIARLDDPEPPRIGILSSLPGLSGPAGEGGYAVTAEIAKSFEIEQLSEAFQIIPPDIDVLFVAHPEGLTRRQLWLIDQFVLRKGRALFLLDPAPRTAGVSFTGGLGAVADFNPLLTAWGLTVSEDVVADAANALPVRVDLGNGRAEDLAHPLYIGVPASDMNRRDPVTADLARTVNFGAPGALQAPTLRAGTNFTPLISTGPAPSFIPAARAQKDMKPAEVLKLYASQPTPFTLAARFSGRLQTAFPSGAPRFEAPADKDLADALRAEADAAPAHIPQSETDAEIILIADTDVLTDEFYIVPGRGVIVADNGAFILNALDALSGGGELSRLRSRAESQRPMERIEAMRANAESRYFRQQGELETRLASAQERLTQLQAIGTGDGAFAGDLEAALSPDERAELQQLRDDIVVLRGRLRDIERDYRRGIDQLESILKAINIWSGPLIVAIAGLVVWRRQRRRGRRRT